MALAHEQQAVDLFAWVAGGSARSELAARNPAPGQDHCALRAWRPSSSVCSNLVSSRHRWMHRALRQADAAVRGVAKKPSVAPSRPIVTARRHKWRQCYSLNPSGRRAAPSRSPAARKLSAFNPSAANILVRPAQVFGSGAVARRGVGVRVDINQKRLLAPMAIVFADKRKPARKAVRYL
jgi:hypothetical protein